MKFKSIQFKMYEFVDCFVFILFEILYIILYLVCV